TAVLFNARSLSYISTLSLHDALPILHHLVEGGALHVLHRDEVPAVDFAELVDLGDGGVGEGDGELGLVDQHPDELLIRGERREDALDDQLLLEAARPCRLGAVDLRHAPRAEPLEEEEFPEEFRLEGDRKST